MTDDDKSYAEQTPYALGESWGRMWQGLKARGVPDEMATRIVIAWLQSVSSASEKEVPDVGPLDDQR